MAYSGKYVLTNPEKYIGDKNNIVYRSSWELRLMKFLDSNRSILRWSSEEIIIPYIHKGKSHRYFPDFYAENNKGEKLLIEVKPQNQTIPPKAPKDGRAKRRFIKESFVYSKNVAKWTAAEAFCAKHGWKFIIMTEDHLLHKGNK